MMDFEASQEYRADTVAAVQKGTVVEQTFISRRARLNGVQLWMRLGEEKYFAQDKLRVQLYLADDLHAPLFTTELPYADISRFFPLTVHFPSIIDSQEKQFLIQFSTVSAPIQIFGRQENAYPEGTLRLNGHDQEADIAFRLSYEYDLQAVLSDISALIHQTKSFILALLFLYIPGRVLLFPLKRILKHHLILTSWAARAALSFGLSISLFPILVLWTPTIGLHWNQPLAIVYCSLFALIYLWLKARSWRYGVWREDLSNFLRPANLVLVIIFLSTVFTRFAMVRDLSAPAWVDSVHHGMITRLIVEQGAFPESYAPYIPIAANYHPGFHALVALFIWLTNSPIHHAILFIGQLLNSLIVFSVFLFGFTLTRQMWVGVFAALATAVVSPMPAYYASWGRYTHLAGLLLLPTCLTLWSLQLDKNQNIFLGLRRLVRHLPLFLLLALSTSALMIIHFRVTTFLILLYAADYITRFFSLLRKKSLKPHLVADGIAISLSLCLTLFFASPWWDLGFVQQVMTTLSRNRGAQQMFYDFNLGYLTTGWGKELLILSLAGLIWSLVRKHRGAYTLVLWLLFLFAIANAGVLRLPGGSFITNASVIISLFLPISFFAGFLFFDWNAILLKVLPRYLRLVQIFLLSLFIGYLIVYGSQKLLPILNPITIFYRQQDDRAMEYIQNNLPEDATILINSFLWGYGIYAGSDGGFWIAPLTGRNTFPPPVLYGLGGEEITASISNKAQASIDSASDALKLYNLMKELNIDYVYIGRKGGAFSAKVLAESPVFETLYTQDGCWLFRRTEVSSP